MARVNPQTFFTFCSAHVPLLRQLAQQAGEWSEADAFRLIRGHAALHEELPETTWRRLRELNILVPTEPGANVHVVAEPVSRLLTYLLDEANPATPEMVQGYVDSLETLGRKLARAIETDDITFVGLAFNEITATLRRMHSDLEETQRAIQNEVAAFKVNREKISVRDRYRRIVYWMERFIDPMVEIVRPDGPMAGAFADTESLLRRAREQSLFNDHPALDRNLRFLRLLRRHALRIFQDCRRELQPLYESLRRSSHIAAGAAAALEQLQKDGLAGWNRQVLLPLCQIRIQHVPGDAAIARALRRVIEHPPEPPPVVSLNAPAETPAALVRQWWLESLPARMETAVPIGDLLDWLVSNYPRKSAIDLTGAVTRLVFHESFQARFTDAPAKHYDAADALLSAHPIELVAR